MLEVIDSCRRISCTLRVAQPLCQKSSTREVYHGRRSMRCFTWRICKSWQVDGSISAFLDIPTVTPRRLSTKEKYLEQIFSDPDGRDTEATPHKAIVNRDGCDLTQ